MRFVLLLACLLAVSLCSSNCGGNCPGGNCPECECGNSSSFVTISDWCSRYSGWDQKCCECIAKHESGGNIHAENYNSWNSSYDIGLWQINDYNWSSCSGGKAPCDASSNLACAKKVY